MTWIILLLAGHLALAVLAYVLWRWLWRRDFMTWTTEDRAMALFFAFLMPYIGPIGAILTVIVIATVGDEDRPARW